jgi:hypothetical protein
VKGHRPKKADSGIQTQAMLGSELLQRGTREADKPGMAPRFLTW